MAGNMSLTVVKVGGGLSAIPGALDRVCLELARVLRAHPLLIVPGGGPFADAVRQFQSRTELTADAAHWMAILAMDQYAHVLADRIDSAVLVEEPGQVREILSQAKLPVMCPYRWMRSADVLPHGWQVTSDSIAAFIAGALGAERLALIKPGESGEMVDPYFPTAVPVGLPCLTLGWRRLDELAPWISGQSAAVGAPE
jgi:5-(aminomethyl)-3-furanmethanol phosphate kinase